MLRIQDTRLVLSLSCLLSSVQARFAVPDHNVDSFHSGLQQIFDSIGEEKLVKSNRVLVGGGGTVKVVPQIDPSVPQPVVQSRRRPLLGPSPG